MLRRASGATWWCLVCLWLLAWAVPDPPGFVSHNERPRLLAGRALVEDGRFDLDAPSVAGVDPGLDVARGRDGRRYPNKAPGTAVLAAATWLVARHAADPPRVHRALTRIAGALVPVVLLAAWICNAPVDPDARERRRAAAALTLLATPLWSYAKVFYGHGLAALFAYGAYRWAGPARRAPARSAAAGLCAGLSVAVEYQAVAFLVPLAVAATARARDPEGRRDLLAGLAGVAAPALALALYHHQVFGGVLETGYHHAVRPEFARIHARGVAGWSWPTARSLYEHLLSPWGGLLTVAPLLVLGLFARRPAVPVEDPSARWVPVVALVVLIGLAQGGGFRVGPRYVIAAMPLFALNLSENLPAIRRRPALLAAAAAAAVTGTAVCGTAAAVFPHLPPMGDPWPDLLVPMAASAVPVPTVFGPLPAWLVVAASVLPGAGLVLAALAGPRAPTRRRGAVAAGAAIAAALLAARAAAPTVEGAAFCRALAGASAAPVRCP